MIESVNSHGNTEYILAVGNKTRFVVCGLASVPEDCVLWLKETATEKVLGKIGELGKEVCFLFQSGMVYGDGFRDLFAVVFVSGGAVTRHCLCDATKRVDYTLAASAVIDNALGEFLAWKALQAQQAVTKVEVLTTP